MATVTIRLHLAWWVIPYIKAVALFAYAFGLMPDLEKVKATIQRGVRIAT